jgi:hypothetical protein
MITTKQLIAKYGKPTVDGAAYLTTIELPFPVRIAWDLDTKTTKMRCHKLVADKFKKVFEEILSAYGLEEIKRLEIDLFGGCFNFRKMRQGNDWSRHSWGVAIDLSPAKNGMNTPKSRAQFAKPEYKKMIDIFKKNGFEWGGDLWNKDCMHFQIKN